jgi:hypothetical protein
MDKNYLLYGKKYPFLIKNDSSQTCSIGTSSLSIGKKGIENPLNPQDAFGGAHNLAVVNFFQEITAQQLTSKNRMIQFAFEFFGIPVQVHHLLSNVSRYSKKNYVEYDAEMMKLYNSSPLIYDCYAELRHVIDDSSILATKIESIKKLEFGWVARGDSSSSLKIILTASSIARYSLFLWNEAGIHGTFPGTTVAFFKPVDWYAAARTDVYGACLAGFTTANPFAALGWGGASSAIDVIDQAIP